MATFAIIRGKNVILVMDVQYNEQMANAVVAGILFESWQSPQAYRKLTQIIDHIEPYQAGEFYKRELPCLLALLKQVSEPLEAIVIDGFVTLDVDQHAGLGMHLYQALAEKTPVIGVAKRYFMGTPQICQLYRGESQNPLYITAAGISIEQAKQCIADMAGQYRLPSLIKAVDQLCRAIG